MKKIFISLAVLGVVSLFAEVNSAACKGCHNPNGLAKNFDLSKLTPDEIVAKLKDYKAGKIKTPMAGVMNGQAARLSDADMEKVAKELGKK